MTRELWTAIDRFFGDALIEPDRALEAALEASAAAGLPAHQVSPAQGKLLELLARAISARAILEVGTLGGYSTIWLARALPAGGRLVTLELDERHAAVARANLAQVGLADRVELRLGPALATLATLVAERDAPFDLIFIDADKPNNASYFDFALELGRPGTLIVVDNVVREGAVLDAASADSSVLGARRLVERVQHEPRVSATALQTVGDKGHDGFLIALVVSATPALTD